MYDAGFGDEERIRADGFDVRPLRSRRYVGRVRELRRPHQSGRARCRALRAVPLGHGGQGGRMAHRSGRRVELRQHAVRPGAGRSSATSARVEAAGGAGSRCRHGPPRATTSTPSRSGVAEANIRALHLRPERVTVVERGRARAGPRDLERRHGVSASERAWASSRTPKVVLAVGRQEHQKRQVDLIAAADAMLDRVPAPAGAHRRAARQRDAGAAAGARRPSAGRGDHHVARAPARRPRSPVRRRRARHPVALRGHGGSRHRGDGAAMPGRVHRRRGCPRHPARWGQCAAGPGRRAGAARRRAGPCVARRSAGRRAALPRPRRLRGALHDRSGGRPGWRRCTPSSLDGRPVEERADEVARASTRVPPRRRGLVEAHRSGGCASSPTTSIGEPEAFARQLDRLSSRYVDRDGLGGRRLDRGAR